MTCDIVIPVWNQPRLTRECVDSIRRHTAGECGRLIIVDNASAQETRAYLESLATAGGPVPVTVIRNGENLGFIKAVNQGIRASTAPCVCVLNNDTVVTKGWLREMLAVAASEKDIGIVNPSSNNLGQRAGPDETIDALAEKLARSECPYVELGAAIGFCMLIRREVLDATGLFDEVYGMGNFEDTDLSRRAVQAGFRCVRACRAYVYHRENTSFRKIRTFAEDFERNREIFEFRWGRPRRIAYILDVQGGPVLKRIFADAVLTARDGNWISFFLKESLAVPVHSNILSVVLGPRHFNVQAAFRILKKKKKFDEIYVGDERLGKFLGLLAFIHKAKVRYY